MNEEEKITKQNQEQGEQKAERKKLPLSSDIVFKRVFSKEENKDLLKSLLEAILNIKIENIEIQNPDAEDKLNQWLWLISGKEEKVKMSKKENEEVKKAIEIIDEMSMDPKEWAVYESRQRALMDYYSDMKSANRKGIEQGEKKKQREIAKKLLELNVELEKIIEATNLSKEEIEKLIKQ